MTHSFPVREDVGNLADLVARSATRHGPDRPALIFRSGTTGTGSVSWPELDGQVTAVARGLRGLDLAAGDRVALALPNTPELAAAYFGALRADLVALPVNPGYAGPELVHLLADSGARMLIGTAEVLAAVAAAEGDQLPALTHRYLVGPAAGGSRARPYAELPVTDGEPLHPQRSGGDLAVLLYTSGTSGRPKGAMLSHRALLANLDQLDRLEPRPLGPDDVLLLALPLFHAFGLGPGLHAVARYGATAVLVERFDPADTLAMLTEHQVTCVLGVPTMFVGWSQRPDFAERFTGVRLAVSGAAPLPAAARGRLVAAGVRIFEGYGLTETAPVVTSTLASPNPRIGSIGRPLPGVSVKLVGPDGEALSAEDSEADENSSPGTDPGEIWVRGDHLFSGYWPDGAGGPGEDGWWPTGDVAYQDDDGDLFLVDRIGELILVSGFNVYPREVEDVLAAHPDVREAAVVGVPHPYTGQAVKAYVVPRPGAAVTVEELIAYCEKNLARFKCPGAVEMVQRLPHSATGKVRKSELRM